MRLPRRGFGVAVAVLVSIVVGSGKADACYSACQLSQRPECLDCRYTAFVRTLCIRSGCDQCIEDYCWVGLPASGERLAVQAPPQGKACTAPAVGFPDSLKLQEPIPPKIIKVDVLNARG